MRRRAIGLLRRLRIARALERWTRSFGDPIIRITPPRLNLASRAPTSPASRRLLRRTPHSAASAYRKGCAETRPIPMLAESREPANVQYSNTVPCADVTAGHPSPNGQSSPEHLWGATSTERDVEARGGVSLSPLSSPPSVGPSSRDGDSARRTANRRMPRRALGSLSMAPNRAKCSTGDVKLNARGLGLRATNQFGRPVPHGRRALFATRSDDHEDEDMTGSSGIPPATADIGAIRADVAADAGTRVLAFGSNSFGQLGCRCLASSGRDDESAAKEIPMWPQAPCRLGRARPFWIHAGEVEAEEGPVTCLAPPAAGAYVPFVAPLELFSLRSLRIVSAACGEAHTCLVSASGELFTCGVGQYGVLGHGCEEPRPTPTRVEGLLGIRIIGAACGWRHTCALSADGQVFSWGHGGSGQLGHGGKIHFHLPLHVQGMPGRARQVSCGWFHTAALLQCDHGSAGSEMVTALHGSLTDENAEVGNVGRYRSCDRGVDKGHPVLLTWGEGGHGQLGLGDFANRTTPTLVAALSTVALAQIECGTYHCAALTFSGQVYTWGMGVHGALGHGVYRGETIPRRVSSLHGANIIRLACGFHSLALSDRGLLYSWGQGSHGQLGHGDAHTESAPRRVGSLRGTRVVGIAAGERHSIALTTRDDVFLWGAALANGNAERRYFPTIIPSLCGRGLVFATGGAAHTILIVSPGSCPTAKSDF